MEGGGAAALLAAAVFCRAYDIPHHLALPAYTQDNLILGSVVAVCLLFILIYWVNK